MTREEFLNSQDFMRLGQALNKGNWQSASMALRRMSSASGEIGLDEFTKKLGQIKICVQSRNRLQALNAMTNLTALRVRYLKEQ